jgi:uncharacterized repeat protein (TIGR01451 family)
LTLRAGAFGTKIDAMFLSVSCRATLALATALLAALLLVPRADAATFTVNRTATDAVDVNVGDGVCATSAANCTLRAAVQEANATTAADTIVLPSGQTANLTLPAPGTASPSTGDLDVTHDLTVQASGATTATIDGGDVDRIFDVPDTSPSPNIVLTVSGVTLRNGKVLGAHGGAILSLGTLVFTDSRVTSSDAVGSGGVDSQGGAITNGSAHGIATVTRSRIDGNSATIGGGISNLGVMTIDRSTLDGNSSRAGESGSGGAMHNGGTLDIQNSTVTGNSDNGGNGGGAVITSAVGSGTGQVTIAFSTFTNNTSGIGSVRNLGGAGSFVNVKASIMLGDCNGVAPISVVPHHNIGGGGSCGLNDASDAPAGTATLGALGDNGGPTPTLKLAAGAGVDGLDDIPAAQCTSPVVDQRGGKRPLGGACDVGAYEVNSLADVGLTGTVAPEAATVGDNLTYAYQLTAAGPDPATGVVLTDPLPAGVSFVSASPGCTGPAAGSGGTVTCAVGALAIGSPQAVSIVVRADAANAALGNLASLSLDQNDPTPASLTLTSAVVAAPCTVACSGVGDPITLPVSPLTLTGLRAMPAKFRTTGGKAASRGTNLSFVLSADAKVTFSVKGPVVKKRVCAGKGKKRRCRTVTKSPAAGSFTANGTTGANNVRFAGKLKRGYLKPGRYTIAAKAAAGSLTAEATTITVTVIRR